MTGPDPDLPELNPELTADLDVDPALAAAVLEIESHIAEGGWDQPARLYALVDTGQLVAREPALAAAMGLDAASEQGSLTPVEQDELAPDQPLEAVLESIVWPGGVAGCAAVVERLVLPPDADAEIPEDRARAEEFAREHPDRQEVRIVAARPAAARRTARFGCAPTTMRSRWWAAPTWCPRFWTCCAPRWSTTRRSRDE
ncbi:PPA1309 family protein [Nocardioides ungokensis]|uniref:PPA1309 family protein n=1 Tax=Nocardioides ungokensis TaxID=1643322 RepID=UPI001FE814F3|nr:PPA1309 family protein [Nocardioides ungokensis]